MNGYLIEFFNGRYVFYDADEFPLEDEFIDIEVEKAYSIIFPVSNGKISCSVKPLKKSPLDFRKIQIAKSSIASVNQVGNDSIIKNRIIEAKTNLYMPDIQSMRQQSGGGPFASKM